MESIFADAAVAVCTCSETAQATACFLVTRAADEGLDSKSELALFIDDTGGAQEHLVSDFLGAEAPTEAKVVLLYAAGLCRNKLNSDVFCSTRPVLKRRHSDSDDERP